mgnify:CR=1 FL=1
MEFDNIYQLRKIIKKLEVYQEMSLIQRKIFLRRNNLKAIDNSFRVIKNIGYDRWDEQTHTMRWNKKIIKNLLHV